MPEIINNQTFLRSKSSFGANFYGFFCLLRNNKLFFFLINHQHNLYVDDRQSQLPGCIFHKKSYSCNRYWYLVTYQFSCDLSKTSQREKSQYCYKPVNTYKVLSTFLMFPSFKKSMKKKVANRIYSEPLD